MASASDKQTAGEPARQEDEYLLDDMAGRHLSELAVAPRQHDKPSPADKPLQADTPSQADRVPPPAAEPPSLEAAEHDGWVAIELAADEPEDSPPADDLAASNAPPAAGPQNVATHDVLSMVELDDLAMAERQSLFAQAEAEYEPQDAMVVSPPTAEHEEPAAPEELGVSRELDEVDEPDVSTDAMPESRVEPTSMAAANSAAAMAPKFAAEALRAAPNVAAKALHSLLTNRTSLAWQIAVVAVAAAGAVLILLF